MDISEKLNQHERRIFDIEKQLTTTKDMMHAPKTLCSQSQKAQN